MISAGGTLTVSSGGVAGVTQVEGGGMEVVFAGGLIDGGTVAGGSAVVSSGGVTSNIVLANGVEQISAGGSAIGTTVSADGRAFVLAGGFAGFATVSSGGFAVVSSGGAASGTTVSSGGELVVSSGGTDSASRLSAGLEVVSAHGLALGVQVAQDGDLILSGGIARLAGVSNGGQEVVASGGVASLTMVYSGGQDVISTGGVASVTTVASGGFEYVSGGTTTGTVVQSGGTQVVGSSGTASGTVVHLGGAIDVLNLIFSGGASTATLDQKTDVLSITEGATLYTQVLSGSYAGEHFNLMQDNGSGDSNGVYGTLAVLACYARGTRILTARGEVAVEDLRIGDAAVTHAGAARPVRWLGSYGIDLARHPSPAEAAPIRIRRDAVAPGVPSRDLLVSPDHAIFLDGVLIQAQALLNGISVTQERPARVEYWHVELDRHDVLLAEGLPAESYLDTGNRGAFAGEGGVRPPHPALSSARAWAEHACATLVLTGGQVAAAHARLLVRAIEQGAAVTDDPALRVRADGRNVLLFGAGRHVWHAMLPAGTRRVDLDSRSFVPAWFDRADADRRRLGLAVRHLRLRGRQLPEAAYGAGWHAAEPEWRWTDGAGRIALPRLRRPAVLAITVATAGARYWAEPAGEDVALRRA